MRARVYRDERAAELLPVLAFDPESKLFMLDDDTIGFGYVADPLYGGDDRIAERIHALLRGNWPSNTLLQFHLISSRDLSDRINAMRLLRAAQANPLHRRIVEERAEFLAEGAHRPIIQESGLRVRNFLLVITCKLPLSAPEPTAKDIERAKDMRLRFEQSMSTVGLAPRPMTADDYLEIADTILNRDASAGWRHGIKARHEPDKLLRDQAFNSNTELLVEATKLHLGRSVVKTLSVKQFPSAVHFGQAAAYIGDLQRGTRGIRDDFIIHATILFPDPHKVKAEINTKRAWAVNQAYGPMLKFVPVLAKKKHGFDVLTNALEDKDMAVRFYLGVTLIGDDDEKASAAASNATSYWAELGFLMMEDRFFTLPFFLHSLPFGADPRLVSDLFRYKTMATRHTIPLLPLFADWKGTGTPVLNFVSRSGQLMDVSLFDSQSNYNAVIAAESGAGKSFMTNEIISSYLSEGGRCWVIDVGRSYEKLCNVYGGKFVHFGADTHICLNPFSIVKNWEDEADILSSLFSAMAAPTQPLTDFQGAQLKRVLKETWDRSGTETTVNHIAAALIAESDQRVIDVGLQLHPFTSEGEYGRFFNGPNTMGFENEFTVLELEELKGRKHLQQVVLLQLIYQIQQDMYLGARDRHKIVVIDEAWDLLSSGDVAKFIETGYRRFRKYGGAAVTVTQSVTDLYDSPAGRAIAENSANMFLLQQKSESIDRVKKECLLPFGEGGYRAMKTVHTVRGKYSEILCVTNRGIGIGRLVVGKFRALLYSTTAEDVQAVKDLEARGMTTAQAIQQLVDRRERARAA